MINVREMGPPESTSKHLLRLLVLSVVVTVCTAQNIRLYGGSGSYEGRVEVKVQGQWGTVCNDTWDINDVAVVCRQLNMNRTAESSTGWFGEGDGPIWWHEVECVGTENELADCPLQTSSVNQCEHTDDAGVVCSPEEGDLRLVGGTGPHEGRVEIFRKDASEELRWGLICDSSDSWGKPEADVACRQVGYPGGSLESTRDFGVGSESAYLKDVQCDGTEQAIEDCAVDKVLTGSAGCSGLGFSEVGVVCEVEIPVTEEFSTGAIVGISIGFGLVILMCILFSLNCDCKACWKKRDADETDTYPYPSNADRTVTSQTHQGRSEFNSASENQAHSQVDSSAPADDPNLYLFKPAPAKKLAPTAASTTPTAGAAEDTNNANLPNGVAKESGETNGGIPGQEQRDAGEYENHVFVSMATDADENSGENAGENILDSAGDENAEQEAVTVAMGELSCAYSANLGHDNDADSPDNEVQSRDIIPELTDNQQTSEDQLISNDDEHVIDLGDDTRL